MLSEHITKAQQIASMLADDIKQAIKAARERPEGPSIGDKATVAYLNERLAEAFALAAKLAAL